jgi:effector-binding domain-containing protein
VRIERREAEPYLGIRRPVTDGIRSFADTAFPELFDWLREHGVAPGGPPFLRYYEVDAGGEPLDVEVGAPVEGAASGEWAVRAGALPAGRYVTHAHVGPYTSESIPDLGDAREALMAYAEENGLVYRRATDRGYAFACAYERFRVGPVDDPDFTRWETELAYLVE